MLEKFLRAPFLPDHHCGTRYHRVSDRNTEPFEVASAISCCLRMEEDVRIVVELHGAIRIHEAGDFDHLLEAVGPDELPRFLEVGPAPGDYIAER